MIVPSCSIAPTALGLSISSSFCSRRGCRLVRERTGSIRIRALIYSYAEPEDHLTAKPGCDQCQADPCKAENTINNTKAAMASNAPIPWVIAFAISSRFREATDFINSKISSKYKLIFWKTEQHSSSRQKNYTTRWITRRKHSHADKQNDWLDCRCMWW